MDATGDNTNHTQAIASDPQGPTPPAQADAAQPKRFSSRQVEFPSRRWLRQATQQVQRRSWWRLLADRPAR